MADLNEDTLENYIIDAINTIFGTDICKTNDTSDRCKEDEEKEKMQGAEALAQAIVDYINEKVSVITTDTSGNPLTGYLQE